MDAVIGIDVGTTHMKAQLFDENGSKLRSEKEATPLDSDGYGSVYRPERVWEIVRSQLESLLACQGVHVVGISITGMAEAGLIVDRRTGKEKTEILPWFDGRTRELAGREDPEKEGEIFRKTGLRNSYKYGIYKFLWLLEQTKMEKTDAVWLSMCDYIAWKLTGRLATEPGFAARTYIYDIVEGCWDAARIREYGLEVSNFPEVVLSGSIAGMYQTADGRRIPVAIAGHDHICAAFALLHQDGSGICDSAGTSETYVGKLKGKNAAASGTDASWEIRMDTGLLYGPYVEDGYFFMANVTSSGHSVEWFRKKLQLSGLSYEEMNHGLEALEKQPTGLLYFPYLTGMGSPLYDASARGTLMGIHEEMDGWTILKGIMEGIQYQSAWLMEILKNEHGIQDSKIYCAGGAVNNRVMMQLKADILNKKVIVPDMPEATMCGAAALFLQKNRGKEAADQFLQAFLNKREIYIPDPERSEVYQRIWGKRYLPMVDILVNSYHKGGQENG